MSEVDTSNPIWSVRLRVSPFVRHAICGQPARGRPDELRDQGAGGAREAHLVSVEPLGEPNATILMKKLRSHVSFLTTMICESTHSNGASLPAASVTLPPPAPFVPFWEKDKYAFGIGVTPSP